VAAANGAGGVHVRADRAHCTGEESGPVDAVAHAHPPASGGIARRRWGVALGATSLTFARNGAARREKEALPTTSPLPPSDSMASVERRCGVQ
jgi:hypothetical protein